MKAGGSAVPLCSVQQSNVLIRVMQLVVAKFFVSVAVRTLLGYQLYLWTKSVLS